MENEIKLTDIEVTVVRGETVPKYRYYSYLKGLSKSNTHIWHITYDDVSLPLDVHDAAVQPAGRSTFKPDAMTDKQYSHMLKNIVSHLQPRKP